MVARILNSTHYHRNYLYLLRWDESRRRRASVINEICAECARKKGRRRVRRLVRVELNAGHSGSKAEVFEQCSTDPAVAGNLPPCVSCRSRKYLELDVFMMLGSWDSSEFPSSSLDIELPLIVRFKSVLHFTGGGGKRRRDCEIM